MSAVIRTKRRSGKNKQLPSFTPLLWLVLGLAVVFFLVEYGQQLLEARQLNEQAAGQRIINRRISDQNARLKASLQYFQSDKYIEQRAREDLNLRRPDEQVLIPIVATPGDSQNSTALPAQAQPPDQAVPGPAGPAEPPPNWQKWLELFTTPG